MTGTRRFRHVPMRVLVLGGGVAGLETCLALQALAGDRVDVTLISPSRYLVHRPVDVRDPLDVRGRVRVPVARLAGAASVRHDRAVSIDTDARAVYTARGYRLPYDALVLAVGAIPEAVPPRAEALDEDHTAGCRVLMHQVREGRIGSLAFVEPPAPARSFDLYDLAIDTAVTLRRAGVDADLTLVTAQPGPLAILGVRTAGALRHTLKAHGLRVVESAYVRSIGYGEIELAPLSRRIAAERVIAAPRLAGPRLQNLPSDRDGFVPVDLHGRVPGLEAVFAAGDCTPFPVKHPSLAAQQADVVASTIAADAGAPGHRRAVHPGAARRPAVAAALVRRGAAHRRRRGRDGCLPASALVAGPALRRPLPRSSAHPGSRCSGRRHRQHGDRTDGSHDDAIAVRRRFAPAHGATLCGELRSRWGGRRRWQPSRTATAWRSMPRDSHGLAALERPSARSLALLCAGAVAAVSVLYLVVPRVAGLDDTWGRLRDGDPAWIALAAALEVLSFAGYAVLLHVVTGVGHRASWSITLAGVAATRLFAAAGAGGIALTAWALAYFVGQLGNTLPLPGGVGGVEGAMVAALVAFGEPAGLAIAGVLTYRALAFWLPTVPGVAAYIRMQPGARSTHPSGADGGAPHG